MDQYNKIHKEHEEVKNKIVSTKNQENHHHHHHHSFLDFRERFVKDQRAFDWRRHHSHHEHHGPAGLESLDVLSSGSVSGLVAQTSLALVLGCYVGCMSGLFFLVETTIHDAWTTFSLSSSSENNNGNSNAITNNSHFYGVYGNTLDSEGPQNFMFYFHWVWAPAVFGGVIIYLIKNAFPECVGGGIDVTRISMAMKAPIPLKVVPVRLILSMSYLGLGGTLGAEAPFLHAMAASSSFALIQAQHIFPDLFRYEHLSLWILIGMTSALGCQFNSPLAGMLFAIEEVMNVRHLGAAFVPVGLSCITGVFFSQAFTGYFNPKHYYESYKINLLYQNFNSAEVLITADLINILIAVLIGFTAAILGNYFKLFLIWGRGKVKHSRFEHFLGFPAGLAVGLLGTCCHLLTYDDGVWDVGYDSHRKMLSRFTCAENNQAE